MFRYLVAAALLPGFNTCFGQVVPFRKYEAGEKYAYIITTESFRNGKSSGKHVAVSDHIVITDSAGVPGERIRWRTKTIQATDKVVVLDSSAQKMREYAVSLAQGGKVLLPKLEVPDLIGEITDLNTFYVAISPALNAQKLSDEKPVFENPEIREGNFADSIRILYGKDCLSVSQQLLKKTARHVFVKTTFSPPSKSCIRLMIPDSLNRADSVNFQMIQKGENGKVNYFWGVESFEITTKLSRRSGKILLANMVNELQLTMLYNASADLKTFDAKLPVTIKRTVHLLLLDSNRSISGVQD